MARWFFSAQEHPSYGVDLDEVAAFVFIEADEDSDASMDITLKSGKQLVVRCEFERLVSAMMTLEQKGS
ncbi:MAG: hypothetical protein NTY19_49870 [Planctomycetota bacterium]|nr:hypothetical protein [Planctomycetota bacterium]